MQKANVTVRAIHRYRIKVTTVMGSILASSDTVESKGRSIE
jgi:hypothetical protein